MMKTWKLFGMMLLLAAGIAACSDDDEGGKLPPDEPGVPADSVNVGDSTEVVFMDNDAYLLYSVFRHVKPEYGNGLGRTEISEAGYARFKEEADGWCAGLETEMEKANAVFEKVATSLTYGEPAGQGQTAEAVWESKQGNCQGYTNCLKVFLNTQGIPCIGANGFVYSKDYPYGAGHAWTYAYVDGEWWIMDALWYEKRRLSEVNTWGGTWGETDYYASWQPQHVDVVLGEDDNFKYSFYYGLSIYGVKEGAGEEVTVPDASDEFEGEEVRAFRLWEAMPDNVRTVRFGENIAYLGEEIIGEPNGSMPLKSYAAGVEYFEIAESNSVYSDYEGIIYKEGFVKPLHVSPALRIVRFRPEETVPSEYFAGADAQVEEIWFAEGTGEIQGGAIIDCQYLKTVYVPEATVCGERVGGVTVTRYRTGADGEVEIISSN